MADTSTIEWTDATWNPITGCTLVSDGCRYCYAAQLAATRLKNHPSREGLARLNAAGEAKFTGEVRLNEQWLDQPLRWRKPRMIFVCAHGDLFHESVPDEWIDRVFAVMALAPQHTFQVLTKRPERARGYMNALAGNEDRCRDVIEASRKSGALLGDMPYLRDRLVEPPLPNVWIGTSVEDQAAWNARWPHLARTPAAVRFVSAEPLLGPIKMRGHGKLDWVIVGGESGRHARPMHPDWARSLRDQCQEAGVAYFFKQWGEWSPVEIWEDDEGALGPAYPIGGCNSYPGEHRGDQECLFWQGDTLVHWPLIKTPMAIGVRRLGKTKSGRLLDGQTWDQMPEGEE